MAFSDSLSPDTLTSIYPGGVPILRERPSIARAREIVLAHGWNSTSYQILNPGIERWFGADKQAVIGYISSAGVRVVAGAPVCERSELRGIAREFESDAAADGERVCYFAAETRLESVYTGSGAHARVLLGAQPVWDPADWSGIIETHASLRAQLNRARNKGVTVTEWPAQQAHNDPRLLECLHRWLTMKGLPPLHFMVEPDTLGRLFDRRVFVAERNEGIAGFLLVSPVARRNGWLFEQFVHAPGAPNGTVELMIDAAMRTLAAEGFDYATLGLSPLSTRAKVERFDNPLWLRILLAWMRKHGRRFYNFDGLDAFKAKLRPSHWEPVFAISNERRTSVRTLYAIASAFSQNAPFKLILGGLSKALATEIRWLRMRFSG